MFENIKWCRIGYVRWRYSKYLFSWKTKNILSILSIFTKEHITPLDLAMASKNAECRAFANSLKPMMSLDDGPILINNSSLLTIGKIQLTSFMYLLV